MQETTKRWEDLTSVSEAARRVAILSNRKAAYQRALQLHDDLMVAALAPLFALDREGIGRAAGLPVEDVEESEGFEEAWNAPIVERAGQQR